MLEEAGLGRRMGAQGGPGLLHGLLGARFGAPPLQGQVCLVCSWKVTGTGLLFQHTWTGWARDKMGTQWSLFLAHGPGSALAVIPFLEPSMSRDDAPKGGALLLPGSKSLFSVPVGLDAMGVWVPSLCPPGWGSWCECSELGSSLHHTGLLWRLEGDPDSSHSLAESPQGLQLEPLALQERGPGKMWGVPNPLQCPSGESPAVAHPNLSIFGQWVQSCSSHSTSHPRHFSCRECVGMQELLQP